MRKPIKIVTLSILLIGLLTYSSLWYFFNNSIDRVLSKSQQELLIQEFTQTQRLPNNFYTTMTKYSPDFFKTNTWNHHLKKLLGNTTTVCQCNDLYLPIIPINDNNFKKQWIPFNQGDKVMIMWLEDKFSQETCFTFHMRNAEFGHKTKSIEEASELFFNKNISQLTEEEVIGLYVIQRACITYSPILHPLAYKRKVNQFMNKR